MSAVDGRVHCNYTFFFEKNQVNPTFFGKYDIVDKLNIFVLH